MTNAMRMFDIFRGRDDVYGDASDRPYCVKKILLLEDWERHLSGDAPIGIYPRTGEDTVHWGCSDFDTEDHVAEGKAVQQALRVMGIPSFPEVSRSGKTHLWVFLPAGTWVPAADMRRTLLLAHWVAEVPAKEINPKNETGGIGNFVRIPYPGQVFGRQFMLGPGSWDPITLDEFLSLQPAHVAQPYLLEVHAKTWTEHHPQETKDVPEPSEPYDGQLDHLVRRLAAVARPLFFDGPNDGDRSEGLWRLANDARRADLSAAEAMALVRDAYFRWAHPKHGDEPDKALWRYYVRRVYG